MLPAPALVPSLRNMSVTAEPDWAARVIAPVLLRSLTTDKLPLPFLSTICSLPLESRLAVAETLVSALMASIRFWTVLTPSEANGERLAGIGVGDGDCMGGGQR